MSLTRNDNEQNSSDAHLMAVQDLWEQVLSMKASQQEQAQDKLQSALLLTTVERLCGILTDYMSNIESELNRISETQPQLLNLQNQYRMTISKEIDGALVQMYGSLEKQQAQALDNATAHARETADNAAKSLFRAARECENAASIVELSIRRLRRVGSINDILFYLAPLAVMVDLVVRLIQLFN